VTAPTLPTAADWHAWHVDPAWSRTLDVASHDGSTHRWHVLERSPANPIGTIVCVHGNPTWSYLWHEVVEQLGDRYRIVAVDQLGMGFSDRIGPRRYAERVRDLDDVITALGIDGPVTLMGHDWGGAVCMGWAVDHPDRLAGMVLCNTGIAVPAGRRAPSLIRLAAAGPITDLACRRTRTFVDGTLRLSWSRVPVEARAAFRAPYRRAADRAAVAAFVADVPFDDAHPSAAAIADVAVRLASVTAPVLLVWGAADPVFDDSFALDLAMRMPHAQQHRFDGIGHLAPVEADVAGVADAWLSSLADAPAAVSAPVSWVPTWAALDERAHDDATAFVDGATGERTSFHELHRRVMGIARGLGELGLQPGERVAMLVPPSVDLVAAVYAVWRAGGVTVVADRGLGLRGLGRAVRGARVDWVIGPPQALAAARALRWAPGAYRIAVGPKPSMGAVATLDDLSRSAAVLPPVPAADDPAAVLYTSGATGPAKGVRYRHHQLAAQRDALANTYGITRADSLVAAFAPFALYGPALGIASTIPDVDVTKPGTLTAEALGAACDSVDATIVFASPAALANVVRTSSGVDARMTPVRLALSAGAPVPVATLRAMSALTPGAEWHTPYGMTECLPVADVSLTQIETAGVGRGVCVGHPVAGVDVMVAPLGFDASSVVSSIEVATTGEVLVRAPWLSEGYDRRWATERDARPADAAGLRWHRSGDVGHVDAEGRLWIEGRSVHVIQSDTGPITPVPVEVAVEAAVADVQRCAAVGIGPVGCQQLVVVVERAGDDGLTDASVAAAVRSAVDHPVAAVLQVSALPVDIRHNTKIDRTLVARWSAGVLSGQRTKRPW
jgi:acyl-CoA synthetase (AMP-forming)/AMP-acid ligase II/pimeloyl-ACP methyl ester carboxylesterase